MRTPKVPEPFAERQVAPSILEGRFDTRAPSEAFGGISPHTQAEENQTMGLAEKLEEQGDQFQIQSMKNAFDISKGKFMAQASTAEGMNAAVYKPDLQDGIYQKWFGQTSQSVQGMAQNDRQLKAINEYMGTQNADMNVVLQKHVAQNIFKANLKNAVDGVDNIIQQVPTSTNDLGVLSNLRKNLEVQSTKVSGLTGAGPDATQMNLQSSRAKFDTLAIGSMLANQDVQGANRYIAQLEKSGDITTAHLNSLKATVHTAMTAENAQGWYEAKGRTMIDSTGNPDLSLIQKNIDAMNLSPQDKNVYLRTIGMMTGHDMKANLEYHRDSWEKFKNWASQNSNDFKNVIPPEKVTAMANQFGRDPQDAYNLEKWYNNQYKHGNGLTFNFGSASLQSQHFSDLREAVALGEIGSMKSLESLQDSLTPKQFTALKNEWFKTMIGGNDSQKQTVLRRIHQMGVDVYGNDAVGLNNYTNAMMDKYHALGSTGDANKLVDEAKDYLKGENPKSSQIWKSYDAQQYKTGYLQPEQIREMYTDYGKEVTDALGQYLQKSLGRTPTALDFQNMVDNLGGRSALQRFTPSNNALLSIIRWNSEHPHLKSMALSRENVQKAVSMYGNTGGIF